MQIDNHDELKIGELPELRILPIGDVLFHEEPDIERVAKLIDRFSADGILKNPPIVARVDDHARRILLDGANRVTALTKLSYPDVIVQEIDLDDPGLVISQWHHAIEHLTKDQILAHIHQIAGVVCHHITEAMPYREADFLCNIVFNDESSASLYGQGDIFRKTELLSKFTELYHKLAYMDRVSYTNLTHLRKNYLNFSALISFRIFSKTEIVALVDAGKRIPSGITRVLLPKRALNFNMHLDILKSNLAIEEKNAWLNETIRSKIINKSIRFYREPTFFFDE